MTNPDLFHPGAYFLTMQYLEEFDTNKNQFENGNITSGANQVLQQKVIDNIKRILRNDLDLELSDDEMNNYILALGELYAETGNERWQPKVDPPKKLLNEYLENENVDYITEPTQEVNEFDIDLRFVDDVLENNLVLDLNEENYIDYAMDFNNLSMTILTLDGRYNDETDLQNKKDLNQYMIKYTLVKDRMAPQLEDYVINNVWNDKERKEYEVFKAKEEAKQSKVGKSDTKDIKLLLMEAYNNTRGLPTLEELKARQTELENQEEPQEENNDSRNSISEA